MKYERFMYLHFFFKPKTWTAVGWVPSAPGSREVTAAAGKIGKGQAPDLQERGQWWAWLGHVQGGEEPCTVAASVGTEWKETKQKVLIEKLKQAKRGRAIGAVSGKRCPSTTVTATPSGLFPPCTWYRERARTAWLSWVPHSSGGWLYCIPPSYGTSMNSSADAELTFRVCTWDLHNTCLSDLGLMTKQQMLYPSLLH